MASRAHRAISLLPGRPVMPRIRRSCCPLWMIPSSKEMKPLTTTSTSVAGGATLGAISTQTLTILDNDQSITFGPLSNKNFGDPPHFECNRFVGSAG